MRCGWPCSNAGSGLNVTTAPRLSGTSAGPLGGRALLGAALRGGSSKVELGRVLRLRVGELHDLEAHAGAGRVGGRGAQADQAAAVQRATAPAQADDFGVVVEAHIR